MPTAQDVVLEFVVRSDGSVGEICHTGRGDEKLVDSVHGYLATCRFKPSVRGPYNPIAVKMIVPFSFRPEWTPPPWWTESR